MYKSISTRARKKKLSKLKKNFRYVPEYSVSPSSTSYQQYVRASNYLFAKITFYELNESKIFAVNG